MTRTPATSPFRITDPAALLAALPYLLGFEPHSSLVVVVSGDPGSRVLLTMRVDLPAPGPHRSRDTALVVRSVLEPVRAMGRVRVHLVVVPPPGVPGQPLPDADLVSEVRAAFAQQGVLVADALVLADGRWWSYLCHDPDCCGPAGRLLDTSAAWEVRAAFVAAGSAPMPSREAVVASVAHRDDPWSQAVARAVARRAARPPRPWTSAQVRRRCRDVARVLDTGEQPGSITPAAAAGALVSLAAWQVRDRVLVRVLLAGEAGGDGLEVRRRALGSFLTLLRAAPAGHVAPVGTCAALLAYLTGDGAAAWAALDRAQDDEPAYSLAGLLATAFRAGMPPAEVTRAFTAAAPVLDATG